MIQFPSPFVANISNRKLKVLLDEVVIVRKYVAGL